MEKTPQQGSTSVSVSKRRRNAICSAYGCVNCARSCVYECVRVMYVCTWLICCLCVMPVTGAITLSSRPLPAGEAVPKGREAPAGGRGREKYPSKLERWYGHAKPLNTLSPHFSLCLRYQPRRWEDMRRASLTPKANECEFQQRLSDGSSLSILWKSLISSYFRWAIERRGTRAALWKAHWSSLCLAYVYHRGPGGAGL